MRAKRQRDKFDIRLKFNMWYLQLLMDVLMLLLINMESSCILTSESAAAGAGGVGSERERETSLHVFDDNLKVVTSRCSKPEYYWYKISLLKVHHANIYCTYFQLQGICSRNMQRQHPRQCTSTP